MEYEPGQHIDGMRVERRMAGGWSDVYEVVEGSGEVAALKMLREGADEFARSLFADEGTTLHELRGPPNVVRILRSGDWKGSPFHLLEFLPHVNEGGRPSKAERVRHLAEICDGLAAAHDNGITHRDVHPSNFRRTREGNWKLIDWGIAFRPGSILSSQPQRFTGTTAVAAPEAFAGTVNDPRSDAYSIGCCLYHILCGRFPFGETGSVQQFAERHRRDVPGPLADFGLAIDGSYQTTIDVLLVKDPTARLCSLREIRERLMALPPIDG